MKNLLKIFFVASFVLLFHFDVFAQDDECGIVNSSFVNGEKVVYKVSYNWFFVWTDVGEVEFSVSFDSKFNKSLLHLKATGKSYPFYDWFFKVRDLYESWVEPVTLRPVYYNRSIYEGGFTKENEYWYNIDSSNVKIRIRRKNGPNKFVTVPISPCTYDVVSSLYVARNFDYKGIEPGKVFPMKVLMDEEVFNVGFHYLGREEKRVSGFGKLRCLKFQVDLVAGDIFSSGQKLMVWVTDDDNKLPVLIESPILVGSVKARLVSAKGLRHAIECRNN